MTMCLSEKEGAALTELDRLVKEKKVCQCVRDCFTEALSIKHGLQKENDQLKNILSVVNAWKEISGEKDFVVLSKKQYEKLIGLGPSEISDDATRIFNSLQNKNLIVVSKEQYDNETSKLKSKLKDFEFELLITSEGCRAKEATIIELKKEVEKYQKGTKILSELAAKFAE